MVFFDVKIGTLDIGRIKMELFYDVTPKLSLVRKTSSSLRVFFTIYLSISILKGVSYVFWLWFRYLSLFLHIYIISDRMIIFFVLVVFSTSFVSLSYNVFRNDTNISTYIHTQHNTHTHNRLQRTFDSSVRENTNDKDIRSDTRNVRFIE